MLYDLQRILQTLSMRETGAVIITSAVEDVFLHHYDLQEFLDLVNSIPVGSYVAPSVVRGALYAESWLAAMGFRRLLERTPFAGLSYLNSFYEVTSLLRKIPQVTIAAIVGTPCQEAAKSNRESGSHLLLLCCLARTDEHLGAVPSSPLPGEHTSTTEAVNYLFCHSQVTLLIL